MLPEVEPAFEDVDAKREGHRGQEERREARRAPGLLVQGKVHPKILEDTPIERRAILPLADTGVRFKRTEEVEE